ncbi:exonuclease RecJ [Halorubrum aethiopicum]|uniref:exonuclease RecJ n=1 Tax=Halorubrum aethiopicum TaxID=1758255 RepID=UPI00082D82F9|nr:exonuclease RecJ [Halorubrum aethiopicum]
MTETTADSAHAPDALASVLADAPFVRLVATDDGDALAAAGTLARALRERGVPFQVRVARDPVPDADGDDVAVVLGADRGPRAVPGARRPASTTAFAAARKLGVEPDPVVALAGVVAAGSVPGTDGSGDALEAAERAGLVSRRPGVAVPTADLADGIAASTLLRTPYSGDVEATRAAIAALDLPAGLDEDDHRRLASLVAVDVAAAEGASARSASAVERALRPYALDADAAPFETVGGYADVLEALAREEPGTGVALALATDPGDDLRTAAVDAWRSHGTAAHRAIDAATTGRYDGCLVARVDAPASVLPTVARVVRDFRSPEPVAVVLDESSGRIAVAATEDREIGDACRSAAREAGGEGWGDGTRGGLAVDGDPTDALAALRGAL